MEQGPVDTKRPLLGQRALIIFAVLANVLVAAVASFLLMSQRDIIEREAQRTSGNLASALASDLDNSFDFVAYKLRRIASKLQTEPIATYAARAEALGADAASDFRESNILGITDLNGSIIAAQGENISTGLDISDRGYFRQLRDAPPQSGFIVSEPIAAKGKTPVLALILAQRINRPDGTFAGIVFTSIRLSSIEEKMQDLDRVNDDVVFLRSSALTTILRHPPHPNAQPGSRILFPELETAFAANPHFGSFRAVAVQVDGLERLFSYHRSERYGFSVMVGRHVDEVFSNWKREVWIVAACLGALAVLTLWLAAAFARAWQRSNETVVGLTQAEIQLRTILSTTQDGFWRVTAKGRLLEVNTKYCEMSGYSRDELLAMMISDIDAVETAEDAKRHAEQIVRNGSDRFETKHRRRDGSTFDVEVSATYWPDEGGQFLVFIHDISQRILIEHQVRSSREQLRQFLDHLPGSAYLKDADSRVMLASMGFKRLFGTDPRDMVGRRSDEIFPGELGRKIIEDDRRILASGKTEVIEEKLGGRIYESTKFVIHEQGKAYLGGITLDETARARNRKRVEALLALVTEQGMMEERAFLTFGLEKAEALTDSRIGFLHFVNEDQESIELVTWTEGALKGCQAGYDSHYPISQAGIWADCFRERKPVVFNDYAGYVAKRGLPTGHARLDRLISVPVIEEGMVRMMMGVGNKDGDYDAFDIESVQLIGNDLWRIVRRGRLENEMKTQLERITALNAKLTQAQGQLLQSEKMASIGQLAAGVAHELNNPIGFIQSNIGTLQEYVADLIELLDFADEAIERLGDAATCDALRQLKEAKDLGFLRQDISQLLAESKDGTDRVRRIVQNLKDFSHVSEEEWSWADLQKGIESTLNLVWNEIKYKAEVDRQFGDLPEVYCMPSQLNQVFMNLLVNAAQAIESKGKITIRSGFEEGTLQEEARVWIEIEDTGKGIPPENLTRIFDPFFTTKPVGKGTGLGLSLAWSIVRKHKGTIKVSSELGKGTTFLIVLPVERVDDEAPDDATDAATNETTQPS
jgi:two-component system NtrC family sensor kinase